MKQPIVERPAGPPTLTRGLVSEAAAIAATVYGIVMMLGWAIGLPPLAAGLLPGIVVKPNAAIGLTLLGAGLVLWTRRNAAVAAGGVALILGAFLLGTLTILEYAVGIDLGIDNAVFREAPGAPETTVAGRMALGAAIGLALLSAAALAAILRPGRGRIAPVLASLGATLAGLSLLGRLYGSVELGDLGGGTAIAPGMALGLAIVSVSVLTDPDVRGPAEVLGRRTPGGRLARIYALASVIILPGLGALAALGANERFFGHGFGVALVVAAGVAALIAVGTFIATWYERLEADRDRLATELLEARKMEAIGRLAGGVAHDINNSLTTILGYVDLAQSAPSATSDYLESIRRSAERSATLARELLAFGEKQMLQPRILDPSSAIRALEPRLRELAGDIEIRFAPGSAGTTIRIDPSSLSQILTDLVANARDAMPVGGTVTITTELVSFDASAVSRHFGIERGDYVSISVTDTGVGMTDETKARVFEPFFTTKPFGGSAGLGLAAAYGAVRQANGQIHVYSEPGVGTTFRLYFPIVAAPTPSVEAAPAHAGARRVLLVEDEPALDQLLTTVLRRNGYEVAAVTSALDAEELLAAAGAPFDLLVSDVAIGSADGRELARRARHQVPGIRVVLMSGFAEESFGGRDGLPADAFIAKPFSPGDFLLVVDRVLSGADRA